MRSILYYITGHGYGHAVRSSQVIAALKRARPEVNVIVRTTAPAWLFSAATYSPRAIDVGVVQQDSLNMDFAETLRACERLQERMPKIVAEESTFTRENGVVLIVGDIPPPAFEVAARCGVPSVAVANFTWSFIYSAYRSRYPAFAGIIGEMDAFYARATLALAPPYSCPMEVFPRREAIPWIARTSALTKAQAREKFGLRGSTPIVLLSFGGIGLDFPWHTLASMRQFSFITTGGAKLKAHNLTVFPSARIDYVDLVRAADVIVTKPGYGIVADALAHGVPVLYTDRGDFPEFEHLTTALHDCGKAGFIPQSDLLAGKLQRYLALLAEEKCGPVTPELNGAAIAAERIVQLIAA